MKCGIFTFYILSLISSFAACQQAHKNVSEPCIVQTDTLALASKLLTLADAERIMGEQAKLTCNTFITKGDTMEYKCDYTSLLQDAKTSKTGKLFFMYEIYSGVAAAANAYAGIYQANNRHEGVEVVSGLGDEAYYHTDKTGFYFFLVRKNRKMFRLKLNKITSHSSAMEFKEVTRHIVDSL
jgi:hypothetical protein